ncbi:MAG: ribosome recycling factor, partial [Peptococcaceae bacterium]|nr:ribosome recycling factor [Peptococcaceae bacterium]
MINTIKQDVEERMNKTISVLRSDLASIRTGVASPALLDKITVDYYGAPTPINQMANISVPEPRMLAIQP